MPLPAPEPGLVINYEFLWSNEYEDGAAAGEKKRPAVIVVAAKTETNQTRVIVAPITHSTPSDTGIAIELPPKVKAHLGLDKDRQWVILNELNEFIWPGVDLYPIPNSPPGTFHYGIIPPILFNQIKERILALDAELKSAIPRGE
jgi:hypothetical protein